MRLKVVFSYGYVIMSFGLLYLRFARKIPIKLCDSIVFLIMESREINDALRETRYISEPLVVSLLRNCKIVVRVESFFRFIHNTTQSHTRLFSKVRTANIGHEF